MHSDVTLRRAKARPAAVKAQNEQERVQSVKFSVGDYLLVAKRIKLVELKTQMDLCKTEAQEK